MKEVFRILLGIAALYWFFMIEKSTNWVLLFGIILGVVICTEIVFFKSKPRKKNRQQAPKKKVLIQDSQKKGQEPKQKKIDNEIIATDLEHLDGIEFERLVAMYYKAKGYKVETTPVTGDRGIDLIITDPKDSFKTAIQCKHWKATRVGGPDIIKTIGGQRNYKCHKAMVITSGQFTEDARKTMLDNKMDFMSGVEVGYKIVKWQLEQREKLLSKKA